MRQYFLVKFDENDLISGYLVAGYDNDGKVFCWSDHERIETTESIAKSACQTFSVRSTVETLLSLGEKLSPEFQVELEVECGKTLEELRARVEALNLNREYTVKSEPK